MVFWSKRMINHNKNKAFKSFEEIANFVEYSGLYVHDFDSYKAGQHNRFSAPRRITGYLSARK
jgi:hypothetical protein